MIIETLLVFATTMEKLHVPVHALLVQLLLKLGSHYRTLKKSFPSLPM